MRERGRKCNRLTKTCFWEYVVFFEGTWTFLRKILSSIKDGAEAGLFLPALSFKDGE